MDRKSVSPVTAIYGLGGSEPALHGCTAMKDGSMKTRGRMKIFPLRCDERRFPNMLVSMVF